MGIENEGGALEASFDLVARQDAAEAAIGELRGQVSDVKGRLERLGRAAGRAPLGGNAGASPEVKSFVDGYLRQGRESEVKSLQGGVPGDGGYAVPHELDARIASQLVDVSPIRRIAQVVQVRAGDALPAQPRALPDAAVDPGEDGFGGAGGHTWRRQADAEPVPDGLRYYDLGRDHQPGLQRPEGRARPGAGEVIEFPGALTAAAARTLINAAAERARRTRDTMAWRAAELDPALAPGAVVRVPGRTGAWRVEDWEWRERGVELTLHRLPRGATQQTSADGGEAMTAPDLMATPTVLAAFELPWDGNGDGSSRQVFAAASSASRGWTGAALYAVRGEDLVPVGASGPRRSVIGQTVTELPRSSAMLFDRAATVDVALVSADFALGSATAAAIATGANRAMIGGEVVQFAEAVSLGGTSWRLRGLLRGRGGTEHLAQNGRAAGAPFVLLDGGPLAIDPATLTASEATSLAAIGLADEEPAIAAIAEPGLTLRPLAPVHPRVHANATGGLTLRWTRRARGAWTWPDAIETPLAEQAEAYLAGVGDTEQPALRWELAGPELELSSAMLTQLSAAHAGEALWVRQVGSFALSPPLLLLTLD